MSQKALTILSHVVHGYVGNRAMVFPLQFLGWNVDAVNTTNFSNHPGYGKFKGAISSSQLIKDVLEGLKDIIDFNIEYDVIVTGYSPDEKVLEEIFDQLSSIYKKLYHKHPVWVVDPVLGDNDKLYVPAAMIPIYQKIFASGFVSLTTPNQFEFELLSGVKIENWETLKESILRFESLYHIPYIAISSIAIEGNLYSVGFAAKTKQIFYFPIDEIKCRFNGCGDIFTALLSHSFFVNGSCLTAEVLGDVTIKLGKILRQSYHFEQEKTLSKVITSVKDILVVHLRDCLLQNNTKDIINKVSFI
ncbi:uncharacterized protein PRCAT00002821001 [Priceomyces carsonii]|uniref:uncharacterized protein n=1 Tax=Priceomyces carsonii TaxID=28549 RepID=UPI002EDB7AC3|nr:unnamed protein product [Priceomyces carsonii]